MSPHPRTPAPRRPERLRPDNVTPPARTPWGGRRIIDCYKRGLDLGDLDLGDLDHGDSDLRGLDLGVGGAVVGEAWEVSVEPSFPSRIARTGQTLAAAIAGDPTGWLGPAGAARYGGQTPLLVKLLDAAQNLSVQVHPAADDPALAPDESGKPEAWIILDAEPGAGIYLGFREGVTRPTVEDCLRKGGPIDALLNFVPVHPGEVFVVEAGTVHAIGAGVTLVEPQHVVPGKRAVTYRFWDWDRRYDAQGRLDRTGQPRALHLDRALAVTDWDAPRGAQLVAQARARPRITEPGDSCRLTRAHLVDTAWFAAERWSGSGRLVRPVATLLALVCVGGEAELTGPDGSINLRCGESAVVPAAAAKIVVEGRMADVIVCWSV